MNGYRLLILLILIVSATAAPLFAQPSSADTPRLEVGLDAALAGPDGDFDEVRTILAPLLTVNLSPRTALSVSGDLFVNRQYIGESWVDSRVVTAELRRGLVHTGRFAMTGLVGGGLGWSRFFQPEYTYVSRNETVTVPASTHTTAGAELTLGVGFEQRVGPRLALRQEVRAVLGELSEVRAQFGVSVPLGRYPARFAPLLTRDGRRPDSLANGTRIGAIIGAAAMAGFVGVLSDALCEGDCDDIAGPVALGAGYGAGVGALIGALIDSFRE
ncbi:MAG: hypothetical protein IT183_08115 [Acidobacteria bacterium]|nr:hypothetical protein [Acidobacteriota bacterium]